MASNQGADRRAILNFEGKRYDLSSMSDEMKRLVKGLQTAEELSLKEITLKTNHTQNTIKTYSKNLLQKHGINNRQKLFYGQSK
jgi:DNA-binding CsgD family transcriptional regulator